MIWASRIVPSVTDHQCLRFAAAEQRRAVRSRQNADLAIHRANFVIAAAVKTFAVKNQLANDFFFDLLTKYV